MATRWLALLCAVLVTHGSLYPWRFQWPGSLAAAWSRLMHQSSWWTGLGDVAGNVVLFVPVGLLGLMLFDASRLGSLQRGLLVLVGGVVFAFALQVAQLFVPARDAALSDVVWNTLGLVLGLLLASVVSRLLRGTAFTLRLPMALVGLWLALEWWPFVTTIDWQHIKDALKPLLLTPRWSSW